MNERRAYDLNGRKQASGPVVYWMHREMRLYDNWGLIHARELADKAAAPLAVVFCLADSFLDAGRRQYGFLLKGLMETAGALFEAGVPFFLRFGEPGTEAARFAAEVAAGAVVTDFDSLRIKRAWLTEAAESLPVSLVEVDSRNVVPCRLASDKQEYMARTIRPRIHRLLPEFLEEFPEFEAPKVPWDGDWPSNDFDAALRRTPSGRAGEVDGFEPGEVAARRTLADFLDNRLKRYDQSNDPNADAVSYLSPYLHFGMLSAQRAVLEAGRAEAPAEAKDAFWEQLIVRRELAENFCFHNPDYDNTGGFPNWARETLEAHASDERPYLYSIEEFEEGRTHDDLWNAAQMQMVETGYMHGYMRMYWAKKILEWSASPQEAVEIAAALNDAWQLDGRDANGYAGIAWSIGGVHDQGWKERPVFGKVRYMSRKGCERKFDVAAYVARWLKDDG